MDLLISFSARSGGNCDRISDFLSSPDDKLIRFREVYFHPCVNCSYECLNSSCKYRSDDIYPLWQSMSDYERILLVVPIYCGNPSSLYFIFNERCQDYFMHNDCYEDLLRRMYVVGVCGSFEESPDFIPCLEKNFLSCDLCGHVLGLQRRPLGQKITDCLLDEPEVCRSLLEFFPR